MNYYYDEVVKSCCQITQREEDFGAYICNLPIFYSTKYDHIKEKIVEDLDSEGKLYVHVYKNFNNVFVYFRDDIEELKKISEYNKQSLDTLINEFKKIGKVSKKDKGLSIEIDYIKAAKYLYKDIYIYTNQKFLDSNQDEINQLCKEVKQENLIVGDMGSREYNLMIKKIISRGDVVVVPSINILEGSINIISFIKDMLNRHSDFIIEDYIGIAEDYLNDEMDRSFILEEIQTVIELYEKSCLDSKTRKVTDKKSKAKVKEKELKNIVANNSEDFSVDDVL